MDLNDFFKPAPDLHPMINMGCLMDIPTGVYVPGEHGESILLGGMGYVEGVAGRGNVGKSTLLHFRELTALSHLHRALLGYYDTETTMRPMRLNALYASITHQPGVDLTDPPRIQITDNTVMSGNEWFAKFRELGRAKIKDRKAYTATTPFWNAKTKSLITTYYPTLFGMDSLSQFMTDSVDGIFEKNEVGDSGANTVFMKGGAAKTQMVMQLPTTTGESGLFITMSIHVGDQIQIDQYAPPKKLLSDMKGNVTFKNVSGNVSLLMNNLWYVLKSEPLQHKDSKTPLYPKNSEDNLVGDLDLRLMTVQNLRAKNGPTGMPFELVWSQSEGILEGLSEFNYIKTYERYGLSGNDRNYALDLYPECSLSRTTIRGKIDTDPLLRRALQITSEMCQMKLLWDDPHGLFITPAELYRRLKEQGYDWNETLLKTRGYWVYKEDEPFEPLPFLSTMDLLRMATPEGHPQHYVPYWYGESKHERKSKSKPAAG